MAFFQDGAPGVGANWGGWLSELGESFNGGVTNLKSRLDDALLALAGDGTAANPGDPGNPAKLAAVQAALTEYSSFRMAQSNVVKNMGDMQKQNIRNLG